MCGNDSVQKAKGRWMCGNDSVQKLRVAECPEKLRNTTQNRSQDIQLVQRSVLATDNTYCTDYSLRRTNSLSERHYLLFIAPRTHARTHSQIPIRTVPHAARFSLPPPYCVTNRQCHNRAAQTVLLADLLASQNKNWPSQPWSRKYRLSGRLVSKIKNLYLRTDCRQLRIHTVTYVTRQCMISP